MDQVVVARLVFACKLKPVEGEGQETITVFVLVILMLKIGAPGVCTAYKLQKPPVSENCPPAMALLALASGCPMVPLTEQTPPVLVPPPPEIFDQFTE